MHVGDRDTYNDVFCQECGNIADKETLDVNGLCEYCRPNVSHIAYYANLVLSDLGMETLVVGFWSGLLYGVGDTSLVPDYLL